DPIVGAFNSSFLVAVRGVGTLSRQTYCHDDDSESPSNNWNHWFTMNAHRSVSSLLMAVVVAACSRARYEDNAPVAVTRVIQTSGTNALLIGVSPVNDQIVWVSGSQGTWLRTVDGGS